MTPTLQRQNSSGSDHGFVVPTAQFVRPPTHWPMASGSLGPSPDLFLSFSLQQGKQRSRSRSGSGSTTPTGSSPAPILPHPGGHLSASQPAIGYPSRSQRAKAPGGTSMSSPARLLTMAGQESTSSGAGGNRNSGRSGRMRASGELQPIMPGPPALAATPSTPRPILPDSSTLLAQLLTSTSSPATLVLSTSADSSSPR